MSRLLPTLAIAIGAAACAAAPVRGEKAMSLEPHAPLEPPKLSIVATRSIPPQFGLTLEREMPTPGWTFKLDALEIDPDGQRITAKVTERGPDGIVAQVITPTAFTLQLGTLDPGRWVFELRTRRDPGAPHRAVFVTILVAR